MCIFAPSNQKKGKIMETKTIRKVVEVTDTPIETVGGRKLIRRVEKS